MTTKVCYTPEPWHICKVDSLPIFIAGPDGKQIVQFNKFMGKKRKRVNLANAKLIVAAPKMIKLLNSFVSVMPSETGQFRAQAVDLIIEAGGVL